MKYIFFGGKGGVGKTTCASAAAIASAERGRRVLVVSTDPAHSLGDVLGRKLTARPANVPVRRGSLVASELDADRALQRWLAKRRPALATILERGTWFDRDDIDPFLDLSLPGVNELMALLEIERLGAERAYDEVIVDTAPTGHTLRLLATPGTFDALARVLDLMQQKHRVLAAALSRRSARDASDALIDEVQADGERLGALLQDPASVRLWWVMLAEEMAVAESARAMDVLRAGGINVSDVIVNRLTPPPPSACALCDGRRAYEATSLRGAATRLAVRQSALWGIPAREAPARGVAALRAVAQEMAPLRGVITASRSRRKPTDPGGGRLTRWKLPAVLRPATSTRLMIIGGKGGVGKTTCAATLALGIADMAPARRVLLLSIDPAHSVADVLAQPVGDLERPIVDGPRNLAARELDAARTWRARIQRYRDSVGRLFEVSGSGAGAGLTLDRAVLEELFELAPPGMDELAAILTMMDTLPLGPGESRHDLLVVDTAPTGHALRLLALPAQALDWVRQLMALVLKYQAVAVLAPLAEELVQLSRDLKRLQRLLANPATCAFIVVTRAEELPRLETIRLIESLRRYRIPRRALIVNALTPPGCARCRRVAARERRQVAALRRDPAWKRGGTVIEAAAVAPPPRGVAALTVWGSTWRARLER